MIGSEKQVSGEVLPAEDSGQAMAEGDAEELEKAKSLACLLCGTRLKCKEADSSVYMVSSKIHLIEAGFRFLVKVVNFG